MSEVTSGNGDEINGLSVKTERGREYFLIQQGEGRFVSQRELERILKNSRENNQPRQENSSSD